MQEQVSFEKLLTLIKLEKQNYLQAIKENVQFENAKNLYLRIKKLEKEAEQLTQQPLTQNNFQYSAEHEIKFQQMKQDFIIKNKAYVTAIEHSILEDVLQSKKFSEITAMRHESVLAASALSSFICKNDT